MKEENVKSPIKATQGDEDRWVDVHDDALMVELGIHPRPVTPRDPSVWSKSKQEKKPCCKRSTFSTISIFLWASSLPIRTAFPIFRVPHNGPLPQT